MKRFILSVIAGVFISCFGFAQSFSSNNQFSELQYINAENFLFTGKIKDASTGLPLPGASVYVQDEKIGAIADVNGMYRFNNMPAGHHLVEVSHTGFLSIVVHVDINSNLQ